VAAQRRLPYASISVSSLARSRQGLSISLKLSGDHALLAFLHLGSLETIRFASSPEWLLRFDEPLTHSWLGVFSQPHPPGTGAEAITLTHLSPKVDCFLFQAFHQSSRTTLFLFFPSWKSLRKLMASAFEPTVVSFYRLRCPNVAITGPHNVYSYWPSRSKFDVDGASPLVSIFRAFPSLPHPTPESN
jgi:hypothetical protein